jgi:hypothetical protein
MDEQVRVDSPFTFRVFALGAQLCLLTSSGCRPSSEIH